MAIIGQSLAHGVAAAAKTTIWSVPVDAIGHLTGFFLTNVTDHDVTVNVYVRRAVSDFFDPDIHLGGKNVVIRAGAADTPLRSFGDMRLSSEDEIKLEVSEDSAIEYFLCGGIDG